MTTEKPRLFKQQQQQVFTGSFALVVQSYFSLSLHHLRFLPVSTAPDQKASRKAQTKPSAPSFSLPLLHSLANSLLLFTRYTSFEAGKKKNKRVGERKQKERGGESRWFGIQTLDWAFLSSFPLSLFPFNSSPFLTKP